MPYLDDPGLDPATARGLRRYQGKVDSAGPYADRVEAGKYLFSLYNRQGNRVFGAVRDRLATMCSGARRCGYCEDSAGDEVEHIEPKDLYPEKVFVWENYLLACGPCNRGKNNRFSVIRNGRLEDVTRRRGSPVQRPRGGAPAPINPRGEDPLEFLDLEIEDTFRFLPREDLSDVDEWRTEYTIEVLKLNRDVLLRHVRGGVFAGHASRERSWARRPGNAGVPPANGIRRGRRRLMRAGRPRSQDAVPAQAAPRGEIRQQPSRTDPIPRKNAVSAGVKNISTPDLHPLYQELTNSAQASLLAARREAYGAYRARLSEYRSHRDDGANKADLEHRKNAITTSAHPTVWREMQRQQALIGELRTLFEEVPEALTW